MQEFEELKQKVAEIEAEVVKADGGNRAAGVRVRKGMQEIKQLCQKVRDRILQVRDQSAGPA
ncbi:MAG TPA: histone H1 [Phycisphaerales bacterium]|nr:histone H1 [Phycisphaerales bacterium]